VECGMRNVKISGLMKLTLLDFPGHTACTVFTAGCNFRCPFCHNASLVRGDGGEAVSEEEFFAFLEKRKGLLDGVAVTGGEPLMHPEIIDFARRVKAMGFAVKIDTNGSFTERLRELIEGGLCDYVAMDIKSSPEGYDRAAGTKVPIENIKKSIDLLKNSGIDYEFRTTVAKGTTLPEDFEGIGRLIEGAPKYFLQGFVDSGDILGECGGAYTRAEMEAFLDIVKKYVPKAEIRGE